MTLGVPNKPTTTTKERPAPSFPLPNVLITGESSTGKTYSFRNMDWSKTAFIDTEVKGFPFPLSEQFKKNYYPVETYLEMLPTIAEVRARDDIRYVVIDSFTDFNTKAMVGERKANAAAKDGFAAYKANSMWIFDFLAACKSKKQITIVTALPEILTGVTEDGKSQSLARRAKVQGREMEGAVEPAFVYAFCTKFVPGKPQAEAYKFVTQSDGVNLAKSPAGAFSTVLIDNDMAAVIKQIEARI